MCVCIVSDGDAFLRGVRFKRVSAGNRVEAGICMAKVLGILRFGLRGNWTWGGFRDEDGGAIRLIDAWGLRCELVFMVRQWEELII